MRNNSLRGKTAHLSWPCPGQGIIKPNLKQVLKYQATSTSRKLQAILCPAKEAIVSTYTQARGQGARVSHMNLFDTLEEMS